jgi:hypothetical protein
MAYNWLRLDMGATIEDPWWLAHLLGGAGLAFCFWRLAMIDVPWRYVLAFALACTGAVAWEAGEFAVDLLAGTTLQKGNVDTMSDLLLSISGAAAYLSFAALAWREPDAR